MFLVGPSGFADGMVCSTVCPKVTFFMVLTGGVGRSGIESGKGFGILTTTLSGVRLLGVSSEFSALVPFGFPRLPIVPC